MKQSSSYTDAYITVDYVRATCIQFERRALIIAMMKARDELPLQLQLQLSEAVT